MVLSPLLFRRLPAVPSSSPPAVSSPRQGRPAFHAGTSPSALPHPDGRMTPEFLPFSGSTVHSRKHPLPYSSGDRNARMLLSLSLSLSLPGSLPRHERHPTPPPYRPSNPRCWPGLSDRTGSSNLPEASPHHSGRRYRHSRLPPGVTSSQLKTVSRRRTLPGEAAGWYQRWSAGALPFSFCPFPYLSISEGNSI